MVETKIVTHDELHQQHVERLRKLRQLPTKRVVPRDDDMRRLLKHPKAGGFRPEGGGAEWPDDSFTFRRLRDGDVLLESEAESEPQPKTAAAKAHHQH
jgi:hypothetical protein